MESSTTPNTFESYMYYVGIGLSPAVVGSQSAGLDEILLSPYDVRYFIGLRVTLR